MVTARYMLDSAICIEFERGRHPRLRDRLLALRPGEALLSLVAYGELRVGAEKSTDRARAIKALNVFLTGFPIATPDPGVADVYASIRATLEDQGRTIGQNDLWIAAHARSAGLTLVTGNERDFRRVPGLAVENWAAA